MKKIVTLLLASALIHTTLMPRNDDMPVVTPQEKVEDGLVWEQARQRKVEDGLAREQIKQRKEKEKAGQRAERNEPKKEGFWEQVFTKFAIDTVVEVLKIPVETVCRKWPFESFGGATAFGVACWKYSTDLKKQITWEMSPTFVTSCLNSHGAWKTAGVTVLSVAMINKAKNLYYAEKEPKKRNSPFGELWIEKPHSNWSN